MLALLLEKHSAISYVFLLILVTILSVEKSEAWDKCVICQKELQDRQREVCHECLEAFQSEAQYQCIICQKELQDCHRAVCHECLEAFQSEFGDDDSGSGEEDTGDIEDKSDEESHASFCSLSSCGSNEERLWSGEIIDLTASNGETVPETPTHFVMGCPTQFNNPPQSGDGENKVVDDGVPRRKTVRKQNRNALGGPGNAIDVVPHSLGATAPSQPRQFTIIDLFSKSSISQVENMLIPREVTLPDTTSFYSSNLNQGLNSKPNRKRKRETGIVIKKDTPSETPIPNSNALKNMFLELMTPCIISSVDLPEPALSHSNIFYSAIEFNTQLSEATDPEDVTLSIGGHTFTHAHTFMSGEHLVQLDGNDEFIFVISSALTHSYPLIIFVSFGQPQGFNVEQVYFLSYNQNTGSPESSSWFTLSSGSFLKLLKAVTKELNDDFVITFYERLDPSQADN